MAKLYNFDRLIDKYSVDFTLITISGGSYVGGKYVGSTETETLCRGAIDPISDSKIYQSGGVLTTKDRQLYMRTPIEKSLTDSKIRFKGNVYKIEQDTNYDDYANAYIYMLKWVEKLSD